MVPTRYLLLLMLALAASGVLREVPAWVVLQVPSVGAVVRALLPAWAVVLVLVVPVVPALLPAWAQVQVLVVPEVPVMRWPWERLQVVRPVVPVVLSFC